MLFHPTSPLPATMFCFGASGMGTQYAFELRHQAASAVTFGGYVDDVQDPRRRTEPGYPVLTFEELLALDDVGVFVSVSDPAGRRQIYRRLTENGIPILGANGSPHLAHPLATLGEGTIVLTTTRLGHSTSIGRGGLILAEVVAHDVEIGDFTTIGIGAKVLGHVQIGANVILGPGAIIGNGTIDRPRIIGDGAVIGTGAVVSRDVEPGEIMAAPRSLSLDQWRALARPTGP